MKKIIHKVYNPKLQSMEEVCNVEPMESDWILLKVVPITDDEWVAVFEKQDF